MRIRSITLHGFKSFGNRTTLELSERVSVIAGPNGSGKSNVVDALRWATGGGRASEFRAGEKTELIFHGASGKRSVSHAEVEVELEAAAGRLTVQRSLQRDGTGRLRLNGRNARFLDIDEALSGSGLGRGSLAIIGQGEIASVLMADPSRLLSFVAEAAGVARLAGRREQAEERLARARGHMERLQDIAFELERQVERLEEEAASANLQKQLSSEVLALQFTIAQARRTNLEGELRTLAEEELQLERMTAALGEDRQLLAQDLRERRELLNRQQELYRKATAEFEAWKGQVRLKEGRLHATGERLKDLRRQLGALQAEKLQLQSATPPQEPEGSKEELEAAAAAAEGKARQLQAGLPELQARSETLGRNLAELQARADRREHESALQQERENAHVRQLQSVNDRLLGLGDAGTSPQAPVESPALQDQLTKLASELEQLRTALQTAQDEHAHALAEARSLEVATERLASAIKARSGFAQGPRLALASGLSGLQGAVADLLQVPDTYRKAIAAALGARSEYIVVQTAEQGQAVISHIRNKGAFVTVLPLDLIQARPLQLDQNVLEQAGVVGPAIRQISFEARFEPMFRQLLGFSLIMEDLESAIALARGSSNRPRLVTLEGDILDAGGAMSGGRRQGNISVLGQARELETLRNEAELARELAGQAHRKLTALQQEVKQQQAQAAEVQRQLDAARKLEAQQSEQVAVREHLLKELGDRKRQLADELVLIRQIELPEEVSMEQLEDTREAAKQASLRLAQQLEHVSAARSDEQQSRARLAVWLERHKAWQAAAARHQADLERAGALGGRIAQLDSSATSLETELQVLDKELQDRRSAAPAPISAAESAYQEARAELERAEQRLEATSEELTSHQQQLERLRLNLARRETMLQAATEEANRFPQGIELLTGSERTLRGRLQEASSELEALGPVNHRAAFELEQERLRARQLASDLLDAEGAASELLASLAEVDAEVTNRSEAAIAAVRESFLQHVSELFGEEAEAGIEVLRQDGRPTGLAIKLQPPGKRTTQLNLLSVGERTMGALAFLFALMHGSGSRGLPLAILDEVDAPLDEANIGRFAGFVTRLSERGTQFLLISHQKTTFKVADTMWGVTSDKGVSSVFSISRTPVQAELTLGLGS